MNNIDDVEALMRLNDYCKSCHFKIATSDFVARGLESTMLTFKNDTNASIDNFIVTGQFGGENFTETEGRLLEVLHHFNLLDENEIFVSQSSVGKYRSTIIRQPWERGLV